MKTFFSITFLVFTLSNGNILNKQYLNTGHENFDMLKSQGKSFWILHRTDDANKIYHITQIINNNCNHCGDEMSIAFGKYLVMNDYSRDPRMSLSEHDVSLSSMEKRRDERIFKYKQMGYRVIQHNFYFKSK
jgi:hypothetical protein